MYIAAPVTNKLNVRIAVVLDIMVRWATRIVDVKGSFSRGEFKPEAKVIFMEDSEDFEEYYSNNSSLMLLHVMYGLTDAILTFWKEISKVFQGMSFKRRIADL